jgi:hypothetical protein
MAAYVRELLVDSIYGRSLVEDVVDLNNGIKKLLDQGVLTTTHIRVLKMYLSGYSLSELLLHQPNAKELLTQALASIEKETRYFDEHIIQMGLSRYPKYKKITEALRRQIMYYSRTFDSINTTGVPA